MSNSVPLALSILKEVARLFAFSFAFALIGVMLAAMVLPILPGQTGLTPDSSRTVFSTVFVVSAIVMTFVSVRRFRKK